MRKNIHSFTISKNVAWISDLFHPSCICVASRLQNYKEFGAVGLWLLLYGWENATYSYFHRVVAVFEGPRRILMSAAPPCSACSTACSCLSSCWRPTPLSRAHSSNENVRSTGIWKINHVALFIIAGGKCWKFDNKAKQNYTIDVQNI